MNELPLKECTIGTVSFNGLDYNGIGRFQDIYVKVASKINRSPIRVQPSKWRPKKSLEDVLTCAKAYNILKEEGMYHPDTQAIVCKDDEGYLTVMVTMPVFEIREHLNDCKGILKMEKKLEGFEKKYGLPKNCFWDLKLGGNQGLDKKGDCYVHDIHLAKKFYDSDSRRFRKTLKIAKKIVKRSKKK